MNSLCISIKSRKALLVFLCLLLSLVILSEFTSALSGTSAKGETAAQRLEFLRGLGISPDMASESVKDAVIPETFSDVYTDYNELNKMAGYDLSDYSLRQVKIYEYSWQTGESRELFVHLIVCEKEIIGGDICDNRLNGEMYPLSKSSWKM